MNHKSSSSVWRNENTLFLPQKVNWVTSVDFRKKLYGAVHHLGYTDIKLDFSRSILAYPNGMVPIIVETERYRHLDCEFTVVLPEDENLRSLFNTNCWIHFLAPSEHHRPPDSASMAHLPLSRFVDDNELNSLVNRSMDICLQQLVFAQGVPQAFEWALNEIAGNVLVHSGGECGWIQVVTFREHRQLALIVCDAGVGIPQSMRARFTFRNDIEGLELAIRAGVTSKPDFGQGNGLAGAISIAQHSDGRLTLTSGRGYLRVIEGRVEPKPHFPPFQGTCVEMQFSTDKDIDLPKALWGHKPTDYFETKFEDDTEDELVFNLREYAASFGNRITGERIRNLVLNLVKQNPARPVRIKMQDIGIISSSFADELFGKLFVEFGPLDFGRIIRIDGVNAICKSIIDQSVAQRLAQSVGPVTPVDSQRADTN